MKKTVLIVLVLLLAGAQAFATHNRAGEITYRRLSFTEYEVTITTYTKASSAQADRQKLLINWGDGTSDSIPRVNGPGNMGEIVPNAIDVKKNIYKLNHVYPGPGSYIMWFEDPNRNADVNNIPNSVSVPFYVESMLLINPLLGINNSPVLFQPPIDMACVSKLFIHNPNAYDPDGDSLSYQLVACKGVNGNNIPGYTFPQTSSTFGINNVTGDLTWNAPVLQGEYNVSILVEEWRNGARIGFVTRDMQINVVACNNNPPVIIPPGDFCVEANTLLSFDVTATDLDGDVLTLSATGAPFTFVPNQAMFPSVSGTGSITGNFSWVPVCGQVRKAPYQVVFKAQDNNAQVNLVDLKSSNITVVGPSPKNPTASPIGNSIQVGWDANVCNQVIKYDIYRRNGFFGFVPGPCETGVPAYTGYTRIGTVNGVNTTSFLDNNNGSGLAPGVEYCYMIVAIFPDGAESYASFEVCTQLKKDLPVITNVSINSTSTTTGDVYVAWSKPTELDTVVLPGPYRYVVMRATGFLAGNFTAVATFNDLNDTLFTDTSVNTKDAPLVYKIEFYNDTPGNMIFVGKSQNASSVFLTATPTDNRVELSWQAQVPWINNFDSTSRYEVYRKDPLGAVFNLIGTSASLSYTDAGLDNGQEFCYYVKSIGHYTAPGFVDPIINLSQEVCATPVDNEPPCQPLVTVLSDCKLQVNTIYWYKPSLNCPTDIDHYNLYFQPQLSAPLQIIATISTTQDTVVFVHTGLSSILGCYAVTAVDSVGNESAIGSPICVNNESGNCLPEYNLPNVFTPNSDGVNDLFHPCDQTTDIGLQATCPPYRFVESVDMKIYNRWGQLVFETTNIDINWDGKSRSSGNDSAAGVYFYVCRVSFLKIDGTETKTLKGFVHLMR